MVPIPLHCEQSFLSCMAFSIYEVITLLISTMRLTSDANDFVNNKHHARDNPLLPGYYTAYTLA